MASEACSEFLLCFVFVHGSTPLVDDDADFHKALSQVDFSPFSKINALKDFGNSLFRQHRFDFAADCYDKACRLLCYALTDKMDRDLQSFTTLAVSLSLNLAACANKLQAFEGALIICSMVLNFFPRNTKAVFRTAVALRGLNRFSEAKCALEKASLIEPHNRDVIELLEEVRNSLVFNQSAQHTVVDLDTSNVQHGKNLGSSLRLQEVDVVPSWAGDITSCSSVMSDVSNDVASSLDAMELGFTGCESNEVCCTSVLNVDMEPCSNQEGLGSTCSDSNACCSSVLNADMKPCSNQDQGNQFFTFKNSGGRHSNLRIDTNSYKNLLEGKTIYVHRQKLLTTMTVRAHNLPQKEILTGTPHEDFSREAVVPSSGPLTEKLSSTSNPVILENVELVKEETIFHINKKKRLTFDASSISTISTTQFEFTAVKEHLLKKGSCKVEQTKYRGQLSRTSGNLKKRSLVSVELLSSFCRYTKTVAEGKENKRKDSCIIQFDKHYHPPVKKRRISSCSVSSFSTVSWVSSSLGPSTGPVFVL